MTNSLFASPDDMHEQAGQYVLGTLSAAQRQAIEQRLPHDAALRDAVQEWEDRLLPLTGLAQPVSPPTNLWSRIERSVVASAAAQPQTNTAQRKATPRRESRWDFWNNLQVWRTLTAGSFATAAILAVVLTTRMNTVPEPQYMVVLVAPQDKAPGWVIQASTQQKISLIPLASTVVPADKALQFWTKGNDWNAPVSLGLVKPGQSVQIPLDRLPPLQPDQLFELTLEPSTGSPTGKPTGPIQFIGRAVKVT